MHAQTPQQRVEEQPGVHLIYRGAIDLRINLLLSQLDLRVIPISRPSRLPAHCALVAVDVGADLVAGAELIEKVAAASERSPIIIGICTNGSIDFF